jgi:hypothetical protein
VDGSRETDGFARKIWRIHQTYGKMIGEDGGKYRKGHSRNGGL